MTMQMIMLTLKLLNTVCMLCSKIIAGSGRARLISWFSTTELVDCLNRVFDCYIRLYQSFLIFIGRVQPTFGWTWALPGSPMVMFLKRGTQLIFKISEVYSYDHTCKLEYCKNNE